MTFSNKKQNNGKAGPHSFNADLGISQQHSLDNQKCSAFNPKVKGLLFSPKANTGIKQKSGFST